MRYRVRYWYMGVRNIGTIEKLFLHGIFLDDIQMKNWCVIFLIGNRETFILAWGPQTNIFPAV